MAFQKQLTFFDGAIARSGTSDDTADIMIAQVPGGASGLSIGMARITRLYGQIKTAGFNNLTNIRFQAHLRNATGSVNEEFADDTVVLGSLNSVNDEPFWNFAIPVVPELRTADRIRVTYTRSGTAPTTGEVWIGLIIGGAPVSPRVTPGATSWDATGLRIA